MSWNSITPAWLLGSKEEVEKELNKRSKQMKLTTVKNGETISVTNFEAEGDTVRKVLQSLEVQSEEDVGYARPGTQVKEPV